MVLPLPGDIKHRNNVLPPGCQVALLSVVVKQRCYSNSRPSRATTPIIAREPIG